MFENEWFPKAYAIGITWEQFWTFNPHIVKLLIKGHKEKVQEELEIANSIAFYQGQYNTHALLCTVGNMLSGKTSKKYEYPSEPFEIFKKEAKEEFTEEELQQQREAFVARLMALKYNFDSEQKNKKKKSKGDSVS